MVHGPSFPNYTSLGNVLILHDIQYNSIRILYIMFLTYVRVKLSMFPRTLSVSISMDIIRSLPCNELIANARRTAAENTLYQFIAEKLKNVRYKTLKYTISINCEIYCYTQIYTFTESKLIKKRVIRYAHCLVMLK